VTSAQVRFELTCVERDEFDRFAEQTWTDSRLANLAPSAARGERLSPAANSLTLSVLAIPLFLSGMSSSFRIPYMDTALPSWTPADRESFFTAIARHRRAAWRVHAISVIASGIVAFVVALLLSPLFYVALSLLCDLANLIVPTINLAGLTFARISPLMDDPAAVTAAQWLELAAVAAIPGLIFMLGVLFVTRRAVILSGMLDGVQFNVVAPNSLELEEQRFRNVVGEMAIAAGLAEPRVLIADWPSQNGAVFGANDGRAVVVVSRQLIHAVDRAQLQGIAAHLVGSIANGDMAIGVRVATTLGLFGLIARLGGAFTQRASMARLMRALARVAFRPTPQSARDYVDEIAQPFRQEDGAGESGPGTPDKDWRAIAWMPFAGTIFATGFFGGIISLFALEPLVSFAWRRRKYLADATAVRLTRDPNALAAALAMLGGGGTPLGVWGAHLCVVRPAARSGGLLGSSIVPAFPATDRRLRALAGLGADAAPEVKSLPLAKLVIIAPLCLLVGVLLVAVLGLLVWLSVALSMMFLGLPFGALHLLLRWIGH
jgi:Zn-dependent protease with chaperone function